MTLGTPIRAPDSGTKIDVLAIRKSSKGRACRARSFPPGYAHKVRSSARAVTDPIDSPPALVEPEGGRAPLATAEPPASAEEVVSNLREDAPRGDQGNDDAWALLIGDLKRGDCIPFLGAGASAGRLPLGSELAKKWARRVGYPLPNSRDLSSVMQYAATTFYRDATRMKREFIAEEFANITPGGKSENFPAHSLLAEYGLPLYVTTNYDDLMLYALQQTMKDATWDLCPWYAVTPDDWPHSPFQDPHFEPRAEHPLVFHLHGHHSVPRSLVLTEDDYLDFLVRLAQGSRHTSLAQSGGFQVMLLPDYVHSSLRTKPLLFIGYGLRDWSFRVLFRTLMHGLAGSQLREHASVQLDPHRHLHSERRYLEDYFAAQRIRILWETPESFIDKLSAGLRAS